MPAPLLQLTEQQNDQALEVALGGKVIIALGCNRATGHAWSIVQPLPAELRQDGDAQYNAPPAGRPAAWGEEVFTFAAVHPGSARLRMAYARQEEPSPRPGRTFSVIINVRGSLDGAETPAATRGASSTTPPTGAPARKSAASKKTAAARAPAKKSAAKKAPAKKTPKR